MEDTKKTILVFCANEQKETDHKIDIDGNGEVVLTCIANVGTEEEPIECGRFLKFPKGTNAATLKESLAKHKAGNEGQITVESQEAAKDELIKGLLEA